MKKKIFNNNTELCVDLKTMLLGDRRMKAGKDYLGVLRRDVEIDDFRYDEHFTFTEALPWTSKRNPHIFVGKYITVTRRDDGTLRLNFRPIPKGEGFRIAEYAVGVANEVLWALEGRVEEE